jgi:PepSY-associated TM region
MRRRPRLVGLLWRWHRRLGVLAAFFVLVLATTGIVLNHSAELGLDRRFVDWPWLSQAYGDDSGDLPAFQAGAHWLSRAANGRIYFDAQEVAPCSGKLVGAVASGELLYAGCTEELLLITHSGELVESINASTGLPVPLQAVGLIGSQVVVQAGGTWWLADLELMDFSHHAPAAGAVIRQLVPDRLPDAMRAQIPVPDQWLSWERLLLDLHSGRVVGRVGVLWVDGVGVLLAGLAVSGITMWWLHRRRRLRHPGG